MIRVSLSDRLGARASFLAEPGQRLLHAGLAAGIGLPHECATGTCGNCKAALVDGEAPSLWPAAPGYKVCRKTGEMLLCQAMATVPVEVVLPTAFIKPCDPPCADAAGFISVERKLTPDVAMVRVKLDRPMTYRPGQFVLLSGFGVAGPRAYSMTRCATDELELHFLIRRSHGGFFTTALFRNHASDAPVSVFGPLGRATFDCAESRSLIAIAGGSGIAGILSMIDHAILNDHFRKHPSHVYFGLKDAKSSYLLDELSKAAWRSQGGLGITVAFSDAPCSADIVARYPAIEFAHGLIHDVMRDRWLSRDKFLQRGVKNPVFFVAGPPAMVNAAMRSLVVDCKISPTEIRYDRFG